MPFPLLAQLLIGVGLQILGYLLAPQNASAASKPPSVKDLDAPKADAGMPIPKVFGSKLVKGPNLILYADVEISVREVPLGK